MVNLNRGAIAEKASACESGGIVRPEGTILEAQVGGGANALRCTMWVLWVLSLHCMWCHSCGCCATWVLQLLSLHCVGCCSYGRYAACGVTVVVVAPCVVSWLWLLCHISVMVTVFVLYVVSWLPSLHHM